MFSSNNNFIIRYLLLNAFFEGNSKYTLNVATERLNQKVPAFKINLAIECNKAPLWYLFLLGVGPVALLLFIINKVSFFHQ
jgi:hypothetical protein